MHERYRENSREAVLRRRKKRIFRQVLLLLWLFFFLIVTGAGAYAVYLSAHTGSGRTAAPTQSAPPTGTFSAAGSGISSAAVRSAAVRSAASSKPAPSSRAVSRPAPTQQEKPASYFDDALLIGDSRTQGLELYDGLGNATYYAVKGLTVRAALTKPEADLSGKKMTATQAASQKKFGKVYIMLGMNELGWSSTSAFVDEYGKLIDLIRREQPKAKIILQSILPVSEKKSEEGTYLNNRNIASHNQLIRKLAAQKGAAYLDATASVAGSGGVLPDDAAVDGIHLKQDYCRKWCEFLKSHPF